MQTFWLSMHVGYRCQDSGVCCSSGWPIPVERDRAAAVEVDVAGGRVSPLITPWLTAMPGAPADIAGVLAIRTDGHCAFHRLPSAEGAQAAGCAIYAHRPVSCAHFPYVCAIDPRGVRVTLSHYCPTAAQCLFDWQGPVTIVRGRPIVGDPMPEGLDARDSLPPLAADGRRLMDWDEVTAWEEHTVQWAMQSADGIAAPDIALFETARNAVAAPLTWPVAIEGLDGVWRRQVAPAWAAFSGVVGRYLASKVFGSWALYRGPGRPDVLRAAEIARAVLKVEAARRCLQAGRPLDSVLLKEAIRRSELLLIHYAEPQALHGLERSGAQSRPS